MVLPQLWLPAPQQGAGALESDGKSQAGKLGGGEKILESAADGEITRRGWWGARGARMINGGGNA